jgi:hypothetical protein
MRTLLTRCRLIILAALLTVAFGPTASLLAQGYSNTNPYQYWVTPGACNSTVSGNGTGTNGLTTVGASATPVVQAQTTNVGTNTHTFICNISPPSFIVTSGTGLQIISATFFYGVQTTDLGTQDATLASGTMNSAQVFSRITYPTPGIGETASTVTPARADSGTLAITPVVASSNVAVTTAGAFYSVTFTPATGTLAWKTDLRQLLLTVALLNTATSATITNSPGVLVRFRSS